MKLQSVFSRYKGTVPTGAIALGADGASDTIPTGTFDPTLDKCFQGKFYSNQGWPPHRVVVGYAVFDQTTKLQTASADVQGQLWVWDSATGAWLRAGTPVALKANQLNFFDIVSLMDSPFLNNKGQNQASGQGGVEAMLLVDTASGAINGEHRFGLGLDLTVQPF